MLNKTQMPAAPAMERTASWGYQPAIDGLRSVAVVSVLLFHFDRQVVGGGFAGGRLTYQDTKHLSDAGTAMVRPLLAKAIANALANCSDRC
jgi:peptidoglycan/LPS O-acetylase OafA/YrhL